MKIGILIAGLVPYGAEMAAIRLAQGMKEMGIDVSILVTDAAWRETKPISRISLRSSPVHTFAPPVSLALRQWCKTLLPYTSNVWITRGSKCTIIKRGI